MGKPLPIVAQTAIVAALAVLAACDRVAASDREGDILFVTIDTLRPDFVSAYGAPFESTPHLDALAAQGVLLEAHHAVISLTAPSHLSMFTGLLPTEHGLRRNGPRFPDEVVYLPEVLQSAGYRTGAFLGSSIMKRKAGFARGFEVFDDRMEGGEALVGKIYERPAEQVVDGAVAFLADTDGRPTFLWVHLYDPHEPYRVEERAMQPAEQARAAYTDQLEPSLIPEAQQLRWRRAYEAEVRATDAQVGRLLAAWDRHDRGRKGLVVVTSDHGQGLGEHDYGGHGFHLYQEQLLVPFVARMPGRLPAGRRVATRTTALDLPRTLLELVGLDPAGLRGGSLVPLLSGATDQGRPALLAERREWTEDDIGNQPDIQRILEARAGSARASHAEQIVLLRPPWKFLWTADGAHQLYDLERDPAELEDRAASESDLVARLAAEVEAWRASVEAGSVDEELSEETLQMLRALGY